jgi:hypothetical protein
MTSWREFEQQASAPAAYRRQCLGSGVAYLGTVRPDGGPRARPVTPIITGLGNSAVRRLSSRLITNMP